MELQKINLLPFIEAKKDIYAYDNILIKWFQYKEDKYRWLPINDLVIKKEIFEYCRKTHLRFYKIEELDMYFEELKLQLLRTMSESLVQIGNGPTTYQLSRWEPIKNDKNANVIWHCPYILVDLKDPLFYTKYHKRFN